MSRFNANKVYNFVLINRNVAAEGGRLSFRTYTDRIGVFKNPGAAIFYDDGTMNINRGTKAGKVFSLDQNHYNIQAREGQKDYKGLSMIDFLMNAGMCWGSPNGTYEYGDGGFVPDEVIASLERDEIETRLETGEFKQIGAWFKLMNSDKDAEIALEAAELKNKAESSALAIDEKTLEEIAALIGVYGTPGKLMKKKVLDFASKRPADYLKLLNAGDRPVRAIVRKCIEDGTFTRKGQIIMWEETVIGPTEDDAVSTLMNDKNMLEALQTKAELNTDVKIKGKPGPKKK